MNPWGWLPGGPTLNASMMRFRASTSHLAKDFAFGDKTSIKSAIFSRKSVENSVATSISKKGANVAPRVSLHSVTVVAIVKAWTTLSLTYLACHPSKSTWNVQGGSARQRVRTAKIRCTRQPEAVRASLGKTDPIRGAQKYR